MHSTKPLDLATNVTAQVKEKNIYIKISYINLKTKHFWIVCLSLESIGLFIFLTPYHYISINIISNTTSLLGRSQ